MIPFRLTEARFGRGPALPYVGSFPETNVRLYSVDAAGRRGVVFRSLESARLAFVLGARWTLGLNYTWARMQIEERGDVISYRSRRRWPAPRGAHPGRRTDRRVPPCPTSPWPRSSRPGGDSTPTISAGFCTCRTARPWPLVNAELLDLDDDWWRPPGYPD